MAGPRRPAAATGGPLAPPSQGTAHPGLHSAGAAAGSPQCMSLSRGPTRTMVTIAGTCREEYMSHPSASRQDSVQDGRAEADVGRNAG